MPTVENLSHEETTRRSKYRPLYFVSISSLSLFFFLIDFSRYNDNYNEGKQRENSD